MEKINVNLIGLTCEGCVKLAKKRLEKIEGVTEANVELSGKTEITSNRPIANEEIRKALADTKYSVQ